MKSRRYVLAFALMIALTAQAKAQVVLDDHTPCSAAVEAFDSHDKEKMREVVAYIESVFGQLDQRQRDSGEVGMLAEPNERGEYPNVRRGRILPPGRPRRAFRLTADRRARRAARSLRFMLHPSAHDPAEADATRRL